VPRVSQAADGWRESAPWRYGAPVKRPWKAIVSGGVLAVLAVLACSPRAGAPQAGAPQANARRELWFYQSANLADDRTVDAAVAIWRRAAAAGYQRVVLADARFARLAEQGPAYFAHVARLRALADSLRLEIVPGVCTVGRENNALLEVDPNLAEALPVRNALFEVTGGIARLVPDPPVALGAHPNALRAPARLDGDALVLPCADPGEQALFEIDVSPWRCYHVSADVAGEGFRGEARLRVTGDGRELAFAAIAAPRSADFERRDVVFNSQACRHVTLAFSHSRDARGALRWRNWRIEEAGPVNLVRRPGLAFRFAGLEEGRDFEPVRDSLMGRSPYRGQFDVWHEPPVIHVHRPDGTRLRADWHEAAVILRGQVACCLSDTTVLRLERDEIARVRAMFGARTLLLMHDEVRALGGDSTCLATGHTPGRILADHVRALRAAAGDAHICVWNDMFDPFHNAVPNYYLVQGDLAGSWDGLDRNVTVINWNSEHTAASLGFFAGKGMAQVWGGYYDGPPDGIREVLPLLDRTPNVVAILYATWQNRYDDLEAFARAARGP